MRSMRIVVTDVGLIWNHNNPALEQFKDRVLVVCIDGKTVTDKYECFVSPFRWAGLGMDKFGVESRRYRALETVADELEGNLRGCDDILFLTDGQPESLYPFFLFKDRKEFGHLHLWAMSPWRFEGKWRHLAHKEMLSDLSGLSSVLYTDSNDCLSKIDRQTKLGGLFRMVEEGFAALLPQIVDDIQKLREKSYFDFSSRSYVPVRDGYDAAGLIRSQDVPESADVLDYPKETDQVKEEAERLPARIDGKKICAYLRELRIELAKENGILFSSPECPSLGSCAGTCAKCDEEAAYLRDRLAEIPEEKRRIPDFVLTEWEVRQ